MIAKIVTCLLHGQMQQSMPLPEISKLLGLARPFGAAGRSCLSSNSTGRVVSSRRLDVRVQPLHANLQVGGAVSLCDNDCR